MLTELMVSDADDIDTHGFSILDQLRARSAHVESFLMDRYLAGIRAAIGRRGDADLARAAPLRPQEQALYDDLRDNRLRKQLRLEQERIGFGWVASSITRIGWPDKALDQ